VQAGLMGTLRWCAALAKTLSGWPRGCCRFHPTCSEYAARVMQEQPPLAAAGLIVRRLVRCGPWSPGGYDPPPATRTGRGKCYYE